MLLSVPSADSLSQSAGKEITAARYNLNLQPNSQKSCGQSSKEPSGDVKRQTFQLPPEELSEQPSEEPVQSPTLPETRACGPTDASKASMCFEPNACRIV